ncbi:hypothetical protein AB0H12_13580 [Actinosynnema sp. NPDC023794]
MDPDERPGDGDSAPPRGEVVTLRFDGREVAVWWGPDGDVDRLAARGPRILTWPTADACEEHARRAGWTGLEAEDDGTISRSTLDFEPAQAWLRGRAAPDPGSALNLRNFHWDVQATATGAWPARKRVELRCHGKLTAANVPWLAGETVYRPRWTAVELRCLRRVLNESVHALRTMVS